MFHFRLNRIHSNDANTIIIFMTKTTNMHCPGMTLLNTFIWSSLHDHKVKFEKKKTKPKKQTNKQKTRTFMKHVSTRWRIHLFFFLELGKCPKEFNSSKLPYNWKFNWVRLNIRVIVFSLPLSSLLLNLSKGGFPLARNFYLRTRVKFTCVNKTKAMYERLLVNVIV